MKNVLTHPSVIIYSVIIVLLSINLYNYVYNYKESFIEDIKSNCKVTSTKISLYQWASWNSTYGNNKIAPTISQCNEYLIR